MSWATLHWEGGVRSRESDDAVDGPNGSGVRALSNPVIQAV